MRYLLVLLISVSLFACNSSDTSKKEKSTDTAAVKNDIIAAEAAAADTLPLPAPEPVKAQVSEAASACSRMAFFQPGAEIVTANYNEKGEEVSKQLVKIISVREKKGITTASCEGYEMLTGVKEKAEPSYFEYQCDGKNIFFNISSMFNERKSKKETGVTSSLISFPVIVKEGQSLPDVRGFINSTRGEKKVSMKYVFRDRKVGPKEKLTNPAGSWDCYRVSNTIEVELDIPGMDENSKEMLKKMQGIMKMTSSTWVSPDFGILKMEMYLNGELKSRNEVIAVKR